MLGGVLRKTRGSGCWRECWRGCCSSFLSKENPLAVPSPALPPAPRIFAALFSAPSPAIFWISPLLYSVAGRPGRNKRAKNVSSVVCSSEDLMQTVVDSGIAGEPCEPNLPIENAAIRDLDHFLLQCTSSWYCTSLFPLVTIAFPTYRSLHTPQP